ncbi:MULTISPECIES: hypothetical protein [Streptomyces]|uniref:hypothetical protein n=1 Tax=Streptomyces TaxID=1883 RepID=UPI0022498B55|nr:hypothetical protein [Streptomyces sp. JHD 1]MCX2967759.1 hypothetical protein [Streptomyces sp. JHD 1]
MRRMHSFAAFALVAGFELVCLGVASILLGFPGEECYGWRCEVSAAAREEQLVGLARGAVGLVGGLALAIPGIILCAKVVVENDIRLPLQSFIAPYCSAWGAGVTGYAALVGQRVVFVAINAFLGAVFLVLCIFLLVRTMRRPGEGGVRAAVRTSTHAVGESDFRTPTPETGPLSSFERRHHTALALGVIAGVLAHVAVTQLIS